MHLSKYLRFTLFVLYTFRTKCHSHSVSLCVIKSNIALSCPVFLGEQRTSTLVYEVLVLLQYGF